MRRFCAALIVTLVAVLSAADPLVCPDRCTEDDRSSQTVPLSTHDATGACLLCLSGLLAAPNISRPAVALRDEAVAPEPDVAIVSHAFRRVERPPRIS